MSQKILGENVKTYKKLWGYAKECFAGGDPGMLGGSYSGFIH